MSIVVLGSINMDLVIGLNRVPASGETLLGRSFTTAPGGKGANQAVAAARMGAPTSMIGRIGADVFGSTLREMLRANQVDDSGVSTIVGSASGIAAIMLEASGANRIVVVPGANGLLGDEELAQLDQALHGARVLLLQLEVPLDIVIAAAQMARARNITVILDPAPARPLPPELYACTDILTPNEVEAATLIEAPLHSGLGVSHAARELLARGARSVIIKMSENGVYWTNGNDEAFVPAFPVTAIDTVAAGDAFNGALAAALSEGRPMPEALRWASAAGALAVTRRGAQEALPRRAEVLDLVERAGDASTG